MAEGKSPPTGTQVPVSQPVPQLGLGQAIGQLLHTGPPATDRGGPSAFLLDPTAEGKGLLVAAWLLPVTGLAFATTGPTLRIEDGFGCT